MSVKVKRFVQVGPKGGRAHRGPHERAGDLGSRLAAVGGARPPPPPFPASLHTAGVSRTSSRHSDCAWRERTHTLAAHPAHGLNAGAQEAARGPGGYLSRVHGAPEACPGSTTLSRCDPPRPAPRGPWSPGARLWSVQSGRKHPRTADKRLRFNFTFVSPEAPPRREVGPRGGAGAERQRPESGLPDLILPRRRGAGYRLFLQEKSHKYRAPHAPGRPLGDMG